MKSFSCGMPLAREACPCFTGLFQQADLSLHRTISSGKLFSLSVFQHVSVLAFVFLMKILVTGGVGFIGSHSVEYIQDRAEVRVMDDLRSGFRHNLDGFQCELLVGSILDRDPHALSPI